MAATRSSRRALKSASDATSSTLPALGHRHQPDRSSRGAVDGLQSQADAEVWMLKHQLGRRNLTTVQRIKLALLLEPHRKAEAKKRMLSGEAQDPAQLVAQGMDDSRVNSETAADAGVSREQIRRFKAIEAEADDDTKEAVASGKQSIAKAYQETRPSKSAPKPPPPPTRTALSLSRLLSPRGRLITAYRRAPARRS